MPEVDPVPEAMEQEAPEGGAPLEASTGAEAAAVDPVGHGAAVEASGEETSGGEAAVLESEGQEAEPSETR
jgi:hypothetical protein